MWWAGAVRQGRPRTSRTTAARHHGVAIKRHEPSIPDRIVFWECSTICCRYFQQGVRAWELRMPAARAHRADYVFGSARNSGCRAGRARGAAAEAAAVRAVRDGEKDIA